MIRLRSTVDLRRRLLKEETQIAVSAERKALGRVNSESLGQLAYSELRASIIEGRIPQGEKLVEARIAAELGISRAPLREALRRLVNDGLVVEQPRHGASVRELTGADFTQLYNMRLGIEGLAVRLVVQRAEDVDDLDGAIDEMRQAAQAGNVAATVSAELRFHELLSRKSGNSYLIEAFDRLAAQIQMALTIDDTAYENLEDVADEHEPVVAALRAGDELAAVRRIEEHILSTVDAPLGRLGGERKRLLRPLPEGGRPTRADRRSEQVQQRLEEMADE